MGDEGFVVEVDRRRGTASAVVAGRIKHQRNLLNTEDSSNQKDWQPHDTSLWQDKPQWDDTPRWQDKSQKQPKFQWQDKPQWKDKSHREGGSQWQEKPRRWGKPQGFAGFPSLPLPPPPPGPNSSGSPERLGAPQRTSPRRRSDAGATSSNCSANQKRSQSPSASCTDSIAQDNTRSPAGRSRQFNALESPLKRSPASAPSWQSHSRGRGDGRSPRNHRSETRSRSRRKGALSYPSIHPSSTGVEQGAHEKSYIEVANLPNLSQSFELTEKYLKDMFNPTLTILPDFDETKGKPVQRAWRSGTEGTIIMEMQYPALGKSAARILNGLDLLGVRLEVRELTSGDKENCTM